MSEYHEYEPDCWDCGAVGSMARCEDGQARCGTCEERWEIEQAEAVRALPPVVELGAGAD